MYINFGTGALIGIMMLIRIIVNMHGISMPKLHKFRKFFWFG